MSGRLSRRPGWRPLVDHQGQAPRRLGESLDGITRSMGAPGAAALSVVFTRWESIAGPALAAHSWPLSVTRKALVVAVDAPGWATALRGLSAQLLCRVEEAAGPGVAERIEVRVTPRDQRPCHPPVVD